MPGAGGSLGLTGLTGVLADHLQVSVKRPQEDFGPGSLCRSGNQKVDRGPTMAPVGFARKLALDFERSLNT